MVDCALGSCLIESVQPAVPPHEAGAAADTLAMHSKITHAMTWVILIAGLEYEVGKC